MGRRSESIGLTTRSPFGAHIAQAHLGLRRGPPRKFGRPSQPVTLTLPDDVIAALLGIDADLSRAIVRVTQPLVRVSRARLPSCSVMATVGSSLGVRVRSCETRPAGADFPVRRPRTDHDSTLSSHCHSSSYGLPRASTSGL